MTFEKVDTPWRMTIKVYDRHNGETFVVRCYTKEQENENVNRYLFDTRYDIDEIKKNPAVIY